MYCESLRGGRECLNGHTLMSVQTLKVGLMPEQASSAADIDVRGEHAHRGQAQPDRGALCFLFLGRMVDAWVC